MNRIELMYDLAKRLNHASAGVCTILGGLKTMEAPDMERNVLPRVARELVYAAEELRGVVEMEYGVNDGPGKY